MKGQLLAFEGTDGAGKTSISKAVAERLAKGGRTASWHSFPGRNRGTVGELVYRIHHDPASVEVGRVAASSLQALHVAAHLDAIETVLLPALSSGQTVILDRYWWSTLAYGLGNGIPEGLLRALIRAELEAWGDVVPAHVFYVRRSRNLDDTTARVEEHYTRIMEAEGKQYPVHRIENDGHLEDAIQTVLARIAS